jgi:hypothetical protein
MEQDQSQQPGLFEMEVDNEARFSFYETAKWARFLGIVALVGLALLVLVFIILGNRIAYELSGLFPGELGGAGTVIVIFMLILIAICSVLIYFLFKASNGIRLGINTNNQEAFNEGLNALKVYFMIYGIISILTTLSSFFKAF